ncbi:MAG: xanthine dehydrogenase family protein molybdopterin-binding subunit [Oscillospiraceae bacterium]|nr:xanthine dehydrogenase family protein molybdopterin-binding subunit [Oscillospiraceae bacterium]
MYEKESYAVVGKGRPRVDAVKQVTGKVQYLCDMHLPDMLYGKAVYSTEHHANILRIDTSAAEAVPGVHAVITHKDIPHNLIGVTYDDTPVLAEGKVRYKGEMVAAVAAETYEIACYAASLVKVDYEVLPAVFDPREAMKEGAPILHEDKQGEGYQGNIHIVPATGGLFQTLRCGDVEEGFAASDVILERKFATCPQKPLPIENFCTLAAPDGNDDITIWSTQQCVFGNAGHIAAVLKMPLSRVRVICPAMGGGFGEKNQLGTEPVTAVLARKVGRPVKMELTTEESLMFTGTKHPMYFTYKLGAKKDGTLVALKRDCITGAGAYRSVAMLITMKVTYWGAGPYNIPNQYADCYVVATNKQIGAAMRGFGMAQPTFAMEVMLDMLAEQLGMDPLALRRRNMFHDGDHMPTGQAVRATGIGMVLDKVAQMSGWGE